MSNELLSVLEYMEKEKGISRKDMIDSISMAICNAAKKGSNSERNLHVEINPKTGALKAWAILKIVDSVSDPETEIHIEKAKEWIESPELGQDFHQEIDPGYLGRIAAQTARQIIMQRIRRHEKEHIYEQFKDCIGSIVTGVVRRSERGNLFIDFGKAEGVLYKRDSIWGDDYSPGDSIRCLLLDIKHTHHGPELLLTRTHTNFVRKLLEIEVSEILDGTVVIRSIVRDPGYRTKICVDSKDSKVDPVGACVGTKGSRVKNIIRELGREKIDIIRYYDDPVSLLREAIKPAIPHNISINKEERRICFDVTENDFFSVIGKRGQNARLTSKLTGWRLDIEKLKHGVEELLFEDRKQIALEGLNKISCITEEIAQQLISMGITSVEAFEGVSENDLLEAGLDKEAVEKIMPEVRTILEGKK